MRLLIIGSLNSEIKLVVDLAQRKDGKVFYLIGMYLNTNPMVNILGSSIAFLREKLNDYFDKK